MQFPDILKKYRASKGLTQKKLAKELGIPLITVARIEQGTNVRLEEATLNLLGDMMQDKSLDTIDGISGIREWFRCVRSLAGKSEHPQSEAGLLMQNQFYSKGIPERLLCSFESIGFKRVAGMYKGGEMGDVINGEDVGDIFRYNHKFDLVLENKRTQKVWAVDFGWNFAPPFEVMEDTHIRSILYNCIGRSGCNNRSIQKYSLITNVSAITEYLERNPAIPGNIQYDFSVIYFDPQKLQMSTEKNLTFFKNGQGVFDINVAEKSESAILDYAKWTLMFDKRL